MAKATTKAKAPAVKKEKALDKAEVFAYKYIEYMGNATKAAVEVLGLSGNSASVVGSQYLRNVKVQEILKSYMDARRKAFKSFVDQAEFYQTAVVRKLMERMETDTDISVDELIKLAETISRFAGFEIAEGVVIAKANNRGGGGRAQLPGLPPQGVQPGLPQGNVDNSRKVIFMLSPPPMPPNGEPPPALAAQWQELGWKPGVAGGARPVDNVSHENNVRDLGAVAVE